MDKDFKFALLVAAVTFAVLFGFGALVVSQY
ncbi:YnhF family membrane protein [Vibrio profundum]